MKKHRKFDTIWPRVLVPYFNRKKDRTQNYRAHDYKKIATSAYTIELLEITSNQTQSTKPSKDKTLRAHQYVWYDRIRCLLFIRF